MCLEFECSVRGLPPNHLFFFCRIQQPSPTVAGRLEQARRWLEQPAVDDRGLGRQAIFLVVDEGYKVPTFNHFNFSVDLNNQLVWYLIGRVLKAPLLRPTLSRYYNVNVGLIMQLSLLSFKIRDLHLWGQKNNINRCMAEVCQNIIQLFRTYFWI